MQQPPREGSTEEIDIFKDNFKYYKQKQPQPDLTDVIDFSHTTIPEIIPQKPNLPKLPPVTGLIPAASWRIHCHRDIPGFYFIVNPFLPHYQKYWIKRCLTDWNRKPNPSNLDAHPSIEKTDSIWEHYLSGEKDEKGKSLLDKLRWVTLGYHHDWNTKEYSVEKRADFPADLSYLSQYIAEVLGFSSYQPEAAIINYYHLDSTLAGHTDHSELDHQSPLMSISFGQTAIFMLGGTTKTTKPIAVYIHSGDIVVMSKQSRLCYHAVPKILNVSEEELLERIECIGTLNDDSVADAHMKVSPREGLLCNLCADYVHDPSAKKRKTEYSTNDTLCSKKNGQDEIREALVKCTELNNDIEKTIEATRWTLYMDYVKKCRINMNVRQVLNKGQSFPVMSTK